MAVVVGVGDDVGGKCGVEERHHWKVGFRAGRGGERVVAGPGLVDSSPHIAHRPGRSTAAEGLAREVGDHYHRGPMAARTDLENIEFGTTTTVRRRSAHCLKRTDRKRHFRCGRRRPVGA